jgi:uncharacterized membrane-anchored protein YhcB (DUF1043 family)
VTWAYLAVAFVAGYCAGLSRARRLIRQLTEDLNRSATNLQGAVDAQKDTR